MLGSDPDDLRYMSQLEATWQGHQSKDCTLQPVGPALLTSAQQLPLVQHFSQFNDTSENAAAGNVTGNVTGNLSAVETSADPLLGIVRSAARVACTSFDALLVPTAHKGRRQLAKPRPTVCNPTKGLTVAMHACHRKSDAWHPPDILESGDRRKAHRRGAQKKGHQYEQGVSEPLAQNEQERQAAQERNALTKDVGSPHVGSPHEESVNMHTDDAAEVQNRWME